MQNQTEEHVTVLKTLWRGSPLLTAVGGLMLAVLAGAVVGLALDNRTIGGAPAWLKPAKFAASIGVYALTLAWVFDHLRDWRRTRRVVGAVTAFTLVLEMIIIAVQAGRGTTSHFNVGTTLDATLWATMGTAIVVQTVASVAVAAALWRQPFRDAALGWALRLGMVMTIGGASLGGLMTQPTAGQMAQAQLTHRLPVSGAHTVGAPDGGPGLPVTGWSREHGDIRVAHFAGLHALQAMLLIVLALSRSGLDRQREVRVIVITAASYTAGVGVLLWQGLRGQGLLHPDQTSLAVGVVWALASAVAISAVIAVSGSSPRRRVA